MPLPILAVAAAASLALAHVLARLAWRFRLSLGWPRHAPGDSADKALALATLTCILAVVILAISAVALSVITPPSA